MKKITKESLSFIPLMATFWFFVALDSILIWGFLEQYFKVFALAGMTLATMIIKKKEITPKTKILFLSGTLFIVWLTYIMSSTIIQAISHSISFIPFLFIIFWPKKILFETYHLIRLVVIFFAIGGTIVSILSFMNLISFFPYYVLPPREALHIMLGYEYHVYGIIPILYGPTAQMASRVCGMMREPGHFAVILGFIYMIDRYRGKRINLWIIIGGILTFSSNFILLIIITELPRLLTKFSLKAYSYLLLSFLILIGTFFLLPSETRERVMYLSYERNLESVLDALNTSSSLTTGLDERASWRSVELYNGLSRQEFLTGGVKYDTGESLADYRGLILQIGFIGLMMSIITYFLTTGGAKFTLRLSLLLTLFLVMTHRSWMFRASYLYFLSFLAVIITTYFQEKKKTLPSKKTHLSKKKKSNYLVQNVNYVSI